MNAPQQVDFWVWQTEVTTLPLAVRAGAAVTYFRRKYRGRSPGMCLVNKDEWQESGKPNRTEGGMK